MSFQSNNVISALRENNRSILNEMTKKYFTTYLILVGFYFLFRLPDLLAVMSFSNVVFPLNSLYFTNKLLFANNALNHDLAFTIISPSNAAFIQPPGSYIILKVVGKVSHMFFIMFVLQSIVPIAVFHLFRSVSSVFTATVATLLMTYYCTSTSWWASDWIIQPLMLIAFIIVLESLDKKENLGYPLVSGLLAGVIMVFKQNIGIFFAILCLTAFFMNSLKIGKRYSGSAAGVNKLLLWIHITGYCVFGLLFVGKILYPDEAIFYLLPYFIFWGAIARYALMKGAAVSDAVVYMKRVSVFVVSFLALPLCIFLWIGGLIGYEKYWHSLFGMGFKYLHIWDHGILGLIGGFFKSLKPLSLKNVIHFYTPLINLSMVLFTFAVNVAAAIKVIAILRRDTRSDENTWSFLPVASMGIMGMFMFFPLEGIHILVTKLFIFCFIFIHIIKDVPMEKTLFLKKALVILLITVALLGTGRFIKAFKTETSYGSEEIQRTIGAPLEKDIAAELGKQIKVVKRSTLGESFYIVDSSGMTLTTLAALVDNRFPQYYMEMRKGILNREVTEEIISILRRMPFAVVNYNDYQKYLEGRQDDPFMLRILAFLHGNYGIVDAYIAPSEGKASVSQILSFYIMKNRLEN